MYKNSQRDIRLYKRLKMFVHAEKVDNRDLEDGELKLFIRMGSDYSENYYEYEIPLVLSDENQPINDALNVWRPENDLDIVLQELINLKIARNNASFPAKSVYEDFDPEYPE